MKLITWNIQWGRGIDGRVDLERIVKTAKAIADFDVLCVQEVADNFPALEGNDERNQFRDLAALLPGFHGVEGTAVDVPGDEGRRRRFGNAIYSRYTVLWARRHALPWPADPGVTSMPRVAVEVALRSPMGPVRVTTTHLEYYSDVQRRAQAARLRTLHEEACARAAGPGEATSGRGPFDAAPQCTAAILAGDFNFRPEHPAFDDIQAPIAGPRYRDAWTALHRHAPHPPSFCLHTTKYAKEPYCCDFAFVSEDLLPRVRSVAVEGTTQASDHQPLLLEIDDR